MVNDENEKVTPVSHGIEWRMEWDNKILCTEKIESRTTTTTTVTLGLSLKVVYSVIFFFNA